MPGISIILGNKLCSTPLSKLENNNDGHSSLLLLCCYQSWLAVSSCAYPILHVLFLPRIKVYAGNDDCLDEIGGIRRIRVGFSILNEQCPAHHLPGGKRNDNIKMDRVFEYATHAARVVPSLKSTKKKQYQHRSPPTWQPPLLNPRDHKPLERQQRQRRAAPGSSYQPLLHTTPSTLLRRVRYHMDIPAPSNTYLKSHTKNAKKKMYGIMEDLYITPSLYTPTTDGEHKK